MDRSTQTGNTHSNEAFFRLIKNPFKFRLFLARKLPAAFFSGLRIHYADEDRCSVQVPFSAFTKNPFRSTYFACLSMAAEMSTGVLAMASVYKRKPAVSMLVVSLEAKFHKKATGLTVFTCREGGQISASVNRAVLDQTAQTFRAYAEGRNGAGELVAEFWITWAFKSR